METNFLLKSYLPERIVWADLPAPEGPGIAFFNRIIRRRTVSGKQWQSQVSSLIYLR